MSEIDDRRFFSPAERDIWNAAYAAQFVSAGDASFAAALADRAVVTLREIRVKRSAIGISLPEESA